MNRVKERFGDEYTFLEPYVDSATKIKVRHKKCMRAYTVTPNNFLNTKCGRCPYCYPKQHVAISNDEFLDRLKRKKGKAYILLDQYRNSKTKIRVRHVVCGKTYSVLPSNLLKSKGCPFCGGYRKTNADFLQQVRKRVGNEYTFLEAYRNCATKIKARHNNCGTIYLTSPNNFLQGNRCPYCRKRKNWKNILYTEETGWLKKGGSKPCTDQGRN